MGTENGESIVGSYSHFKHPDEVGYLVYGEGLDLAGDQYAVYVHKGADTLNRVDALWIRPKGMLSEVVNRPEFNNYNGPRFVRVSEEVPARADITKSEFEGTPIEVWGIARHSENPDLEYFVLRLGQTALFTLIPVPAMNESSASAN